MTDPAARWADLFADLEAQADELARAERAAEVETRTRGEVGRLTVHDRLRAAIGTSLRLSLAAGGPSGLAIRGTVRRTGSDWLLLEEDAGREVLVATQHVVAVRGLSRLSTPADFGSVVESRLTLRHALRGLARDRAAVRLHLAAAAGENAVLDATLDRVGADFVEVAAHAPGEARRRREVREVALVPLSALAAVQRSL
ncbi:hypothetical protein [uncultured Jatrophihabitans sp.]|uniref:hypothetical protein n=1 Tax=uncultured Jatrophihabitans sp. TaxID=1610747 RepID=UPI0035C9B4A4